MFRSGLTLAHIPHCIYILDDDDNDVSWNTSAQLFRSIYSRSGYDDDDLHTRRIHLLELKVGKQKYNLIPNHTVQFFS